MIRFITILFLLSASCFGQVKQWHLTNTSANVQLQLDNRVMRVATLAELKALPAAQVVSGALVSTAGYTTAGDGGGALYRYDSSSTATANDGSVILPGHGTGRYLAVVGDKVNLLSWGLRLNDAAEGSNNASRFQAAILAYRGGGHLVLPGGSNILYLGPNPVRPAAHVTNLTLELHGRIEVPSTPTWTATHPSLFHFDDNGSYNGLRIFGTATIWGNATNQTTSSLNNFGKMNAFRVKGATNMSIEGINISAFGLMAVILINVDHVRVEGLTIDQTHGNNDTLPTRWGANCDGVHVYDSRNVIVKGCNIQSTDDCIAFTQGQNNSFSTNYLAIGNILRPYAPNAINVPAGIRVSIEPGVTNSRVDDVLLTGNIIKPVGANGIYIGILESGVSRSHARIKIADTIIHGAGEMNTVQIGPNAGTTITPNVFSTGGMYAVNSDDVDVSGVRISNARGKAVSLANIGKFAMTGCSISNVIDATTGVDPRGSGIYLAWGLYGNIDDVSVDSTMFEGLDGGGIVGAGSSFQTTRLRVTGSVFNNWLRGLYSSAGRNYPAILASRSLTNYIAANRFVNGEGSGIVISTHSSASEHEIRDNSFPFLIPSTGTPVGGMEHILVARSGTQTGARAFITGNRFGEWTGRAVVLENLAEAYLTQNHFLPASLGSGVSAEAVYVNFVNSSTGNALLVSANNVAHIGTKGGGNPSVLTRTINNNGSGGSSVVLTTVSDQNVITPAAGMAHLIDGFAGGARELAYSANLTIPNSSEIPIRNRVGLTGNTTLAWANPSPGQRGTLDIYPDTVSRVVTLPSLAYSPTGATFTVNGGTGATNYVRLMWEVHQVGGTNRITAVPQAIFR